MERIDTKLTIHVACEILIIGGVTFYFHKKMSGMDKRLKELEQKNDFFQKAIETHEAYLRELYEAGIIKTKRSPQSRPVKTKPPPARRPVKKQQECEEDQCPIEPEDFEEEELDDDLAAEFEELENGKKK